MSESAAYSTWIVLAKFGMREHLESFRRDGLLYVNELDYFSKLEADKVRSDRFEGSDYICQPQEIKKVTFSNNKTGKETVLGPNNFASAVIISSGKMTNCHAYCMYSIGQPVKVCSVDQRNFDFGDSFVIVLNTQEYLNRVRSASEKLGITCECRPVEYYDDQALTGDTGPFLKPQRFSYQKEFRLVFRPRFDKPLRLFVGDLTDITAPVGSLPKINELVEFEECAA
jgi:hypothetical protein